MRMISRRRCYLVFILISWLTVFPVHAQGVSFLVLGDMHLDKFELHDMDYVRTRPQDFRQISQEYPFFTATYMPHLIGTVKQQVASFEPKVKAVVQLGDLMEGVAGNEQLAKAMARYSVGFLERAELDVPWIIAKGNHDVSTSPGQPQAWKEVVLPFIEKQTGQSLTNGMYTYRLTDDIQFFVLEQFFSPDDLLPESEILKFLKRELANSTAKFKFLITHQPVIPVTERCWHLFSGIRRKVDNPQLRVRFLELLAENQVTVLCAHLHKFSTIERQTKKGVVRQFMFNSVVQRYEEPEKVEGSYIFPNAGTINKSWQPHTLETRLDLLEKERPYIKRFYVEESSGYSIISTNPDGVVEMKYFRGYEKTPSHVVRYKVQ